MTPEKLIEEYYTKFATLIAERDESRVIAFLFLQILEKIYHHDVSDLKKKYEWLRDPKNL
jgi:hypothetical protein